MEAALEERGGKGGGLQSVSATCRRGDGLGRRRVIHERGGPGRKGESGAHTHLGRRRMDPSAADLPMLRMMAMTSTAPVTEKTVEMIRSVMETKTTNFGQR